MPTLDLERLLAPEAADPGRRQRLIRLIRDRNWTPELHAKADQDWTTAQEEARSPEFLWRGLVRVHTTVQGVKTYARFEQRENQSLWSHAALLALSPEERKARFDHLVGAKSPTNPRVQKLMAAFDELGGPQGLEKKQAAMLTLKGAAAKVAHLNPPKTHKGPKPFKGFGPKYSRLFWLDIADPDVSSLHLAIDSRLQQIFGLVWPHFDCPEGQALVAKATETEHLYKKLEKPLFAIAAEAGEKPWRVDRLMFRMFDTQASGRRYVSLIEG